MAPGQTIIFGSSITKGTNTRELRDNVDVDTNRGETIAIMKDKIIKLDLSSYKNIFLQLGRNNAGKDSPTTIYKEYSEILKDIITEDPNKHIIVCAVPPRQHVDVSQVNTCLKKLSIDFDLEFLDNYNAFISKTNKTISGSFHHDSIHLSKNGTIILPENYNSLIPIIKQSKSDSDFNWQTPKRQYSDSFYQHGGYCEHCGEMNHMKFRCRYDFPIRCHVCKHLGDKAKDCHFYN